MSSQQRLIGKPIIWEAIRAHREGIVRYRLDRSAMVQWAGVTVIIPPRSQYDITQPTIFGLNERLTLSARGSSGKTLREEFNSEWEAYTAALFQSEETGLLEYGYYAYYPDREHLVRVCSPYWHRLVAVASSSTLLSAPEDRLTWQQIRDIFSTTTVAVAGCSVGSTVTHSLIMDVRPEQIKIADKSVYKMENINRVRLSYADMVESEATRRSAIESPLRNKARVVAEQLYDMDPFLNVFVYDEGINATTLPVFLDGYGDEPAADIVVEEVDDPRVKLLIREEARRRQLPVIMVTDIGSAVQLDVMPYHRDHTLPLTWGTSDEELYAAMERVYTDPSNRRLFFEFVDALVGTDYRRGELLRVIEERAEIPTATIIPQLGSTAAMAGAIAAETVARVRLGYDYPPRVFIDKHTFAVKAYRREEFL